MVPIPDTIVNVHVVFANLNDIRLFPMFGRNAQMFALQLVSVRHLLFCLTDEFIQQNVPVDLLPIQ